MSTVDVVILYSSISLLIGMLVGWLWSKYGKNVFVWICGVVGGTILGLGFSMFTYDVLALFAWTLFYVGLLVGRDVIGRKTMTVSRYRSRYFNVRKRD